MEYKSSQLVLFRLQVEKVILAEEFTDDNGYEQIKEDLRHNDLIQ